MGKTWQEERDDEIDSVSSPRPPAHKQEAPGGELQIFRAPEYGDTRRSDDYGGYQSLINVSHDF